MGAFPSCQVFTTVTPRDDGSGGILYLYNGSLDEVISLAKTGSSHWLLPISSVACLLVTVTLVRQKNPSNLRETCPHRVSRGKPERGNLRGVLNSTTSERQYLEETHLLSFDAAA